jgi:hypothetical protein
MVAHALHAELLTAHLAGRLSERNDIVSEVQNMILAVRSKLLAFPTRAAHSVLGKEDLKEVITILSSAMEDCFTDLREIDLGAIVERNKKQGRYVGVGVNAEVGN